MRAAELRAAVAAQVPVNDAQASMAVCRAFRVLRNYLEANVTAATGVRGVVFRALFPKTAEGLREVVQLLDGYLAEDCGT